MLRLLLVCAAACLSGPALSASDEPDEVARLERIRQQISALQQQVADTRDRHGQLQAELQRIEQEIGQAATRIEAVEEQIAARQETLAGLNRRRQTQADGLAEQRRALAAQIRAAYIIGRQDYLKILLNQEDPATVGRALTYYDYFNRARAEQIARIEQTLERIRIIEQGIAEESASLRNLRENQLAEQGELEKNHAERRQVLAHLSVTLENQEQELARRQQDKRHLESLLNTVQGAFRDFPMPDASEPFGARQGHLPWPVNNGQIAHAYGSSRGVGSLKWQGVVINAAEGEPVRAVAAGRVVFAGWLRNYGQLLILQHGDGYMSLYGYNRSLHKDTGDWVESGETIASVGDSGGQQDSGLYFEIRRQGNPLDPRPWLVALSSR